MKPLKNPNRLSLTLLGVVVLLLVLGSLAPLPINKGLQVPTMMDVAEKEQAMGGGPESLLVGLAKSVLNALIPVR